MPHRALLLMLLLLLTGCAAGAALDAERQATARAEIARRPEFYTNGEARTWSVRKDGVEKGLLWGTFHIAYSGDTVLPSAVRARFYQAADLTVEAVLDRFPVELRALRNALLTANTAMDPNAFAALDPATRQSLENVVPDAATRKFSLRGLAGLVQAQSGRDETPLLPNVGFVDANLITFARQQNRPVRGLETLAIVDSTLTRPNGPEAAAMLRLALRRADAARQSRDWLRATYGRGELTDFVAVLVAWRTTPEDLAYYDAERDKLLSRRNAEWTPKLIKLFERPGDHFVAIGAGHLLGNDGLVNLLRAKGFQVVPCIRDACPP